GRDRQIEWGLTRSVELPGQGLLPRARLPIREVEITPRELDKLLHDLRGLAVALDEGGAEHRVSLDQHGERFLKESPLQCAPDAQRDPHVVGRILGVELRFYPQAPLHEREGDRGSGGLGQRWHSGRSRCGLGSTQELDDRLLEPLQCLSQLVIERSSRYLAAQAAISRIEPYSPRCEALKKVVQFGGQRV